MIKLTSDFGEQIKIGKSIIKVIGFTLLIIFLFTSIFLGVAFLTPFIHNSSKNRPRKQKSFWEININATKDDVRFIKNNPISIDSFDKDSTEIWYYNKPFGDYKEHFILSFNQEKLHYLIYYMDIDYLDSIEDRYEYFLKLREHNIKIKRIQDIGIWNGLQMVFDKFGPCPEISTSDNGLRRIFCYPKYNLVFLGEKNQVIGLGIYNPEIGPVDFSISHIPKFFIRDRKPLKMLF